MCKLFDVFTRFSVGLIYLMYRAFERVALFKPVTSRPANSERYAVFLKYCIFSLYRCSHFYSPSVLIAVTIKVVSNKIHQFLTRMLAITG